MKQKTFIKLFYNICILLISFILNFNNFNVNTARAACNLTVNFSTDKYNATPSDTVNLNANVTRSGQSSDCGDVISFEFQLYEKPGTYSDKYITTAPFSANTNIATANYSFNLKTFDRSSLANSNQLQFRLVASDGKGNSATSSPIVVNVTGTIGSDGKLNVVVSFPGNAAVFNSGQSTQVNISVTNVSSLDSSIQKFYIGLYVNNSSQPIASFEKTRSELSSSYQKFDNLVISSGNGFKEGTNTVTIKIYQSGTDLNLGQGSATLQAQGLSSSGSITISPQSTTIPQGDKITISAQGLPSQAKKIIIYLNTLQAGNLNLNSSGGGTAYIDISNGTNGLKMTGSNSLTLKVVDANGNTIDTINTPGLNFSVGSSGSGSGAGSGSGGSGAGAGAGGSSVDCQTNSKDPSCVMNPLGFSDITSFIMYIIKLLLGLIGTAAVIMVIIGGFRMVFAQGNEEAFGKARKTVTYAIIGLAVALLSFTIIQVVSNLLTAGK